jgi:hypothetical protein
MLKFEHGSAILVDLFIYYRVCVNFNLKPEKLCYYIQNKYKQRPSINRIYKNLLRLHKTIKRTRFYIRLFIKGTFNYILCMHVSTNVFHKRTILFYIKIYKKYNAYAIVLLKVWRKIFLQFKFF